MSIANRAWATAVVAASVLAVGGCQEPDQIVSTAPPGQNYRETIELKEKESEAIGEVPPAARKGQESGTSLAENTSKAAGDIPPALPTAKGEFKTTPAGVKYTTVKEGTGDTVKAGQRVKMHYVGTLEDGRKFDSSRDRNAPTTFSIGTHSVITGWDEGVPGMKVGEVRKLEIPPSAAYGALGRGGTIPPNATLHFEIEAVGIEP